MIANHKGEIPFVNLLIPFIIGITLGLNYGTFADTRILIILIILFGAVFISLNIGYKRFNIYKIRWIGGTLMGLILFLFGWISIMRCSELNKPDHFSKTPSEFLMIKINNEPVLKNGYLRFTAKVEKAGNHHQMTSTSGTLLVAVKDSATGILNYGDELLIHSKYNSIDPPFNPAEFNYKQYLANKNVYYQQFMFGKQYVVLRHDSGDPVVAYAFGLRKHLVEKLKTNIHDPVALAVASALLLGYRSDLSGDVLETYSKTGTIYVLTVSGAQLAVIYFLLNYLLGFLNRVKYGKVIKITLIIGIIWYYALLTGFSPAICRAVVVMSMVVLGRTYNRYINTLNLLAASAFLLLLYDPLMITEVGFQMGYLAVAGLIIFRPIVYKWLVFKTWLADKIWGVCSVSIAAQVATFPLTIYYFHQFPIYFLVTNLLVVIPVAVIIYTGLLYLLLPQIYFVSKVLSFIFEHTILIMNKLLTFIQQVKFAGIDKIWINKIEYILIYVIIISVFCFFYNRKTWLLRLSLIGILLLTINISIDKIKEQRANSITFLDLRKHTGIIIKKGTSAVVISDLPDTDRNYKFSIQPDLDSSGVNEVQVCNIKQDARTSYAAKRFDLIQFGTEKLLLCTGQHDFAHLNSLFKPEYVYLSHNPYTAINAVLKKQLRQTLIINSDNSDPFINTLKQKADREKIKYAILKRNKSLLLVSN